MPNSLNEKKRKSLCLFWLYFWFNLNLSCSLKMTKRENWLLFVSKQLPRIFSGLCGFEPPSKLSQKQRGIWYFSASPTTQLILVRQYFFCRHQRISLHRNSVNAIKANSNAIGPLSLTPVALERSHIKLCVLELSTIDRMFSTNFDLALIFGIFMHQLFLVSR